MPEPSYVGAAVPVRGNIVNAHRNAWERLSRPGTWWTGAERVAIAAEARRAMSCALCLARKEALSPSSIEGKHGASGSLPEPIVEVIHKIRTDPGRVTKKWYEGILSAGASDVQYVEAVGILATLVGVDTFRRGLGLPLAGLPAPQAGEPSRKRPASAKVGRAWVPMIDPEDATPEDAELYGGLPVVPNIQRALSLVPDEARGFYELGGVHYFSFEDMTDFTRTRAIDRCQIELLAARVSALNQCFY